MKTWTIAKREFKDRLKSRFFISMAFIGPAMIILGLYTLFSLSGSDKQQLNILVSDPANIMNKLMLGKQGQIKYTFIERYVERDEFAYGSDFQKYDALLEINEKIISNHFAFLFQREIINPSLVTRIHRDTEKRLEMLKAGEFTQLNLETFRRVMHPIKLDVRDAYRPETKNNYYMAGYTGFFFGLLILLFVITFGMSILRSSSDEKSNRVAEVMLSIVQPRDLLLGKIIGIGLSAILQTTLWTLVVAFGLFVLRSTVFPDMFSANNLVETDGLILNNSWVNLIYSQINFGVMLPWFLLIFVLSYLFYGSIFAALGAAQGSQSDGQKFLIPILLIFIIALFSGYFTIENPQSSVVDALLLIPFTAPMVLMVKIAIGIQDEGVWTFFLSLLIMVLSALFFMRFAGRVYKSALLTNGYRLNWRKLLRWGMRAK